MIDIVCQVDHNGSLAHCSEEGATEIFTEYKRNQLVRCRITKLNKEFEPSIAQNNLLHACFKLIAGQADNTTPSHMRTTENVKMSCKIGIDFRDNSVVFVRPDGMVQFQYRSFRFDKLRGVERERVMQQAFEWCAEALGLTVDEMVAEAKSRMYRRAA